MVTIDDITKISTLAQINLSTIEKQAATDKINQIVKLIDQINIADTEGIAPLSHPFSGMSQRLRDDVVTAVDQRDALQAHAPAVMAGLYLVPPVMGENDAS